MGYEGFDCNTDLLAQMESNSKSVLISQQTVERHSCVLSINYFQVIHYVLTPHGSLRDRTHKHGAESRS
jgi:hypothetical protein